MLKKMSFHIKGVSGLLMHNGNIANPLNKFSVEMKKITSKNKKTIADHEALARLEFLGSLYMDGDGNYVIPADCWEATLVNAAKRSRKGPKALIGLTVEHPTILKVKGPKDPEERFKDPSCIDQRMVVIKKNRILRTRPFFAEWETDLDIVYDNEELDPADVRKFVVTGGRKIGLLDWRPRYGRYEATENGQ